MPPLKEKANLHKDRKNQLSNLNLIYHIVAHIALTVNFFGVDRSHAKTAA